VRGYADQATFDVSPIEGERLTVLGVSTTFRADRHFSGAYVGTEGSVIVLAVDATPYTPAVVCVGVGLPGDPDRVSVTGRGDTIAAASIDARTQLALAVIRRAVQA
jgi:hypothetical protein